MKLPVIALSILVAFANADDHFFPAFGEGPLYEDIQYFLDMIPMEQVLEVVADYILDPEFMQLMKQIRTDDFKQMVQEIEDIPEFHKFVDFMENNGVYMHDVVNKLNKMTGLPPYQMRLLRRKEVTGGLTGLFNDVKALISYDAIIHGYAYKMRTSQAFRDFVAELKSENHQRFVDALYQNPRFLSYRDMLVTQGLDITLVEDVIFTVLGIQFPPFEYSSIVTVYDSQLSNDIRDFIDLIDMNKVIEIVSYYLDDDQVQEAIVYMHSEEFHELVRKVEALKAYQNLVNYLQDAGLDMYGFLQRIHSLFGMEDYVPPSNFYYSNLGGVKAMVDEVIDILPMDKFRALFQEKMKTSPEFKKFVELLDSDTFQEIVNTIYSEPIFLEVRQKALDYGLDLDRARNVFEEIGIRLPHPNTA